MTTNTTGAHAAAYSLQSYLDSLSPRVSPAISVPPALRSVPGVYAIEFTLCNTAGHCGRDYTELTIYSGVLPYANIRGRRTSVIERGAALLLRSFIATRVYKHVQKPK